MRVLLLGPVEAWAGDHLVPLRRPRERAVLAYLLLARGRMVTLDGIEHALWGGTPPSTARAQIQADISALRRAFRDSAAATPIVTRPGGYELNFHDVDLDMDVFAEQVAAASESMAMCAWTEAERQLRSAIELWRGPTLAGVEAAFAEPARMRLDEQRLTAIEQLAQVELYGGRDHMVIAELTEHVHAHPYRERLRSLLMLALYRSGRRADALASARDLRRRLSDHQGLDPGEAITRLEAMILRDDPELLRMFRSGARGNGFQEAPRSSSAEPSAVPDAGPVHGQPASDAIRVRPTQLPPATVDFTGHADQRAKIRDLVLGTGLPAHRQVHASVLVTISGMGGVGKTALAVKVAHELVSEFPDGCLFRD